MKEFTKAEKDEAEAVIKEVSSKINTERKERLDYLLDKYTEPYELKELEKRKANNEPLFPILHKHREVAILIREFYDLVNRGQITRFKAQDMTTMAIDEYLTNLKNK